MSFTQQLTCGVCILLGLLAGPLAAVTYYVDATAGNDGAPGTARAQAFKTIARAAAVCKPGDEVIVGPGEYPQVVNIGGFAGAAARTVFRAEPPGEAILRGEPADKPGERKSERCRVVIRRPQVSLIGFDVRDTSEHAIEFYEAPGGVVERCILRDNKLDGVFFRRLDGARVENCLAVRNGRHGVWFYEVQHGVLVNTTCARNGQAGVQVNNATETVLFNNIFADNGTGVRLAGEMGGTLHSDYNLYAGGALGQLTSAQWRDAVAGTLADWQELSGQEPHSLRGDPLFRNAAQDDFTPGAPPASNWSPALTAGLRADTFAGITAPAGDLRGQQKGPRVLPAVGALFARVEGNATPFATLTIPADGQVSVGIFDAGGQLVRDLLSGYPVRKGQRELYWDGTDDQGKTLPPGTYEWRAVAHRLRGVDEGAVGDSGTPPYGNTHVPTGISSIAVDAAGNYYTTTFWDEAGFDVVKYNAEGQAQWVAEFYIRNAAHGYGQTIATDGTYVFVGLARNFESKPNVRPIGDQIRRLDCTTGKPANFPPGEQAAAPDPREANVIVVNPVKEQPWLPHQQLPTEEYRRMFAVRGLACDARRLWVSNYFRARVEAYDKATGVKLFDFPVEKPMGIGVAPGGALWICQGGDRVAEYTPEGKPTGRQIANLNDPYQATFGGPQGHLYIAELGAGQLREYDVAGAQPVPVRQFGRKATGPGRVTPDVFWNGPQGLAVDAQGRITLSDPGSSRILRYTAALQPWQQATSDFVTVPFVDERAPDVLVSNDRQYRVDYATGAWEFTHSWAPAKGIRRTLPNGREYLFELGGHRMGVVVWAIEGTAQAPTVRKCAMLGGRWMGNDDLGEGKTAGKYAWQDTNGDGRVQDAEMVWTQPIEEKRSSMSALAPGWWVEKDGTLWLCDQVTKSILKFPLLGFDAHGSPRYDWARAVTVVPADATPWKFVPTNLKTTPQGDLYAQGTIEGKRAMSFFWMGGTTVARYAPDGTRRWLRVLPRVTVSTAVDGTFWYTGEGPGARVTMYTDDGLLLCEMAPGRPSGYTSGWIDHALGLYAFQHPRSHTHYVYAEEDLYGKSIRYRIDGLDTLTRSRGTVQVAP